jgi:molecular chaperone GrpE
MSKDHPHKHEKHDEAHGVPIEIHSVPPAAAPAGDPPGPGGGGAIAAGSVSAEEFARVAAEKEELAATLVRRQADFDNYRKRVERERQEESRRGTGRLLQELLPVLDGFERALAAHPLLDDYRKGVELIYRVLWDTLSRQGLERLAAEGKSFDPHFHEAIERVETHDHPDGSILQVVQQGYLFDGRVLRPSLVRVAAAPEAAGGDGSSSGHSRTH